MDFFQHQVAARKKTTLLVVLYVIAVVLIIAAVYAAFMGIFAGLGAYSEGKIAFKGFWNAEIFVWVIGITLLIVLSGTAFKIAQLSTGGEAVAMMMGGRLVNPNTSYQDERKILNVVEEMAIASGVPVPRVYVMDDEQGINAFAAGFGTTDAVVAVTRGCIQRLNRSELQGVVAHEFSHILNGDMRMNLHLLGILNGILVLGLVGYWVMRVSARMMQGRGRSKGKAAVVPLILFGLLVWLIGLIGVFFGKMIKAAVSRQREFLADASAVQFTRDPGGIAGALRKIGGIRTGSKLASSHAEEASHLFFANGLASSWFSLLATHPPLEERIRRIDPSFEGNFENVRHASDAVSTASGFTGTSEPPPLPPVDTVGHPTAAHLDYANTLLASLPPEIDAAVRSPSTAAAVVYGLLLNPDAATCDRQLRMIPDDVVESTNALDRLRPVLATMDQSVRIAVADLAVTGLRTTSPDKYRIFRDTVTRLAGADSQIDLFEFALQRMVLRRLDPIFMKVKRTAIQYYDIRPLLPHCASLLSCIAYWGADDHQAAARAFAAGARRLPEGSTIKIAPLDTCGLSVVDEALSQLSRASAPIKKTLVDACSACVFDDDTVTAEEGQLLRAVTDSLECPMPPLLTGAKSRRMA